jgi:hypothetical protein
MKIAIAFFVLLMYGKACTTTDRYAEIKTYGYKPVYTTDPSVKQISSDTPHIVKNAGKIYVYKNYILQCEVGEGIHVIDNTNPATARRISFIKVLGANDISIKNDFLYANSFKDLVTINIANIMQPIEVKRLTNAFSVKGYLPVPPVKTYYECVDLKKGVVIGWIKDSVFANCSNY